MDELEEYEPTIDEALGREEPEVGPLHVPSAVWGAAVASVGLMLGGLAAGSLLDEGQPDPGPGSIMTPYVSPPYAPHSAAPCTHMRCEQLYCGGASCGELCYCMDHTNPIPCDGEGCA